jgi:hypothetical protein
LQVYTGPTGAALYDPGTGTITVPVQIQSLMLGSTTSDTLKSFTLAAGASDGGGDGYTVFVGFTTAAAPKPSTLSLACLGAFGFCAYAWRRRNRRARG